MEFRLSFLFCFVSAGGLRPCCVRCFFSLFLLWLAVAVLAVVFSGLLCSAVLGFVFFGLFLLLLWPVVVLCFLPLFNKLSFQQIYLGVLHRIVYIFGTICWNM